MKACRWIRQRLHHLFGRQVHNAERTNMHEIIVHAANADYAPTRRPAITSDCGMIIGRRAVVVAPSPNPSQ